MGRGGWGPSAGHHRLDEVASEPSRLGRWYSASGPHCPTIEIRQLAPFLLQYSHGAVQASFIISDFCNSAGGRASSSPSSITRLQQVGASSSLSISSRLLLVQMQQSDDSGADSSPARGMRRPSRATAIGALLA
ncbi:hypothetical protein CRG98_044843 [Punica granatum]|uniref:Uncharacterized protein n=1 Tax=Punica granatum TaxID=22663 RepID=A0A2I0HU44_PUNGR|nr:hypothetical protein CRG98_044843 [Punica granatum]